MICAFCNGDVEWRGPLSALTHTECRTCHRTNCQVLDPDDFDDDGELVDASGLSRLAQSLEASSPKYPGSAWRIVHADVLSKAAAALRDAEKATTASSVGIAAGDEPNKPNNPGEA